MDSLKVANSSASPLATQMVLFKSACDAKLRPLVEPLVLGPSCEPAALASPASPAAASPASSASSDKTDNHDTFSFYSDIAPDMRREEERLKTFEKWPLSFLSPDQLAKNGFYYLGRGDEVRCAFCKVEIMRWEDGDDPAKDHQRWAPQCPFLKRGAGAGNVPLGPGRDECGARAPPPPSPGSAPRMPGPVHLRYASDAARLRSFKDWPRSMKQKPEELAEAGFFYTGHGDQTKCFYCDGGLKDWENDDVPWEQHARWFDRCAFVQLVKGRDYVQRVLSEAAAIPARGERSEREEETPGEAAPAPEPAAAEGEGEGGRAVEDAKLCRICYNEERNVVFVPCGHVVACARCALAAARCPMCRRTFSAAVRLYFS